MTPEPDPDSPGDADLRALFARTAPAPSPTDLAPLRAALRRRRSAPPAPVRSPVPSRKSPMKLALTAVTALCLAVAAAAFWRAEPAVAFADVRAAVAAAESLRYTRHEREVFTATADRDPGAGAPTGRPATAVPGTWDEWRVLWSGGRTRTETVRVGDAGGGARAESVQGVSVWDADRGVAVGVLHATRRVSLVSAAAAGPLNEEADEMTAWHAALTAWLRDLPPGGEPVAGRRRVGGVEVVGFDVPGFPADPTTDGGGPAGRTARVWADAETARPVLVEVFVPEEGEPTRVWGDGSYRQGTRVFLSDIRLDGPAGDDQFRLDVPPGYDIQMGW